jgi:hypothetical protein
MSDDPIQALLWLVGEWDGEGRGEYPTIEDFEYREHATYSRPRPDKPFFAYTQRSVLADGSPSHAETGYLRALPDGRAELVIAQPTGIVEVHAGTVQDGRIELESVAVRCTPSAKEVTAVRRVLERRGEATLWYRLDMAAVGQPMGFHLEATLHRVG